MQRELPESSEQVSQTSKPQSSQSTSPQHGSPQPEAGARGSIDGLVRQRPGSVSPQSVAAGGDSAHGVVNAEQLNERLRRLNRQDNPPPTAPAGQRILQYENALVPSTPTRLLGFKVVRQANSAATGAQLTDFPNEILTQILSHLPGDSHSAVALVSRRFYALVTTPHAWRMAFHRYFPGQDPAAAAARDIRQDNRKVDSSDAVRSESRTFTRLTSLASWRSEYLLRTRLLRSIARGKPGTTSGGIGSSSRSSQKGKKASAVLTYFSKLPWTVTNIHAAFSNGKKAPRAVHGASDLGVASLSDPTSGKVEKWGLDDPFSLPQLDEVFPQLDLYGAGDGLAAGPNVMDVSQLYGLVGGEGFPGGRVFFRSSSEFRGRYLGQDQQIIDMVPEIPKIPELSEAICSLWIAKSSAVPSMTQSMFGIMTGSSLGVVTTYALGSEFSSIYANGDMTARWVLSPGVPIISLRVDDCYSQKRKSLRRVLAVVLNALGEVYYLKQVPNPPAARPKAHERVRHAWLAGRTVYWELLDTTRRRPHPDDSDKNATRGAYSPRSPSNAMGLSQDQICAEAQEIEKFLRYRPSHFRKVCDGWDMRRRLEVDFAGADGVGFGEGIFVITCGYEKSLPAETRRYSRRVDHELADSAPASRPSASESRQSSIFGGPSSPGVKGGITSSPTGRRSPQQDSKGAGADVPPGTPLVDDWESTPFTTGGHRTVEITASAVDQSQYATLSWFEDPLNGDHHGKGGDALNTPTAKHRTGELPGKRARLFAVGTSTGSILLWNMRASSCEVHPLRVIQTESPRISCLAMSALYLVHGGNDGLAQAWDPLGSTYGPIRTLNSRSSGRIPRHVLHAVPALRRADYAAVGAIFLDPDPTVLRGVLAFGSLVRYWTYSSTIETAGRKRRLRHSDIHGRLASRRQGGVVSSYIAAEEAELRREQDHHNRETARLRDRFGLGLCLTEEEAIRYAEMMSEQSFLDEQRRLSASDTGSAADIGEASSTTDTTSTDTLAPEPGESGLELPEEDSHQGSPSPVSREWTMDDDYEQQIQRALRLSLLEGVNDLGQSPNSSGEYEYQVKYKTKRGKRSPSSSPVADEGGELAARPEAAESFASGNGRAFTYRRAGIDEDQDLELALRLSLLESRDGEAEAGSEQRVDADVEFPPLAGQDKGKGKGV